MSLSHITCRLNVARDCFQHVNTLAREHEHTIYRGAGLSDDRDRVADAVERRIVVLDGVPQPQRFQEQV